MPQVPTSNSHIKSAPLATDSVKSKKVIPMVAKKASGAATNKTNGSASVKVSATKSAGQDKDKKAAKVKVKKDPLAPKQATNAYMFFAAKQRSGKVHFTRMNMTYTYTSLN